VKSTDPPKVTFLDYNESAHPGYKLSCLAIGTPPIYTAVTRNSTVLVNTSNTASIHVYKEGNYSCVATSRYGTASRELSVSFVGENVFD